MTVVKFPYKVSRRLAARRPRRSKNGTPEERAAKRATEAEPRIIIPRRSKNGSPEERAANKPTAAASVIDVTAARASLTHKHKGRPSAIVVRPLLRINRLLKAKG